MLNALIHGVQAPRGQKDVIREYKGGVKFWNGGSSLTVFWDLADHTETGKSWKGAHRQVNGPSEEGIQGYLVTSLRSPLCNLWPALRDENGMPMAVAMKIQDRLENKVVFSPEHLPCER